MSTTYIENDLYQSKLKKLFESTEPQERMVMMQQSLSPLKRVDNPKILNSIIDPTTGHPYEGGIILEGEFASIDTLNNNNRFYGESNYLDFIEILKHQIHSGRGLYGELEHPKSYAVDYNNVSHKILDIWYDKDTKKVFGVILILTTPKGLIAQQIVKSGGQLAISARGGGAEVKNPDGSITAILKLLTTFDVVCHPGFSSAILGFKSNSELFEHANKNSVCIYEQDMYKLDNLFESFTKLSSNQSFFNWMNDAECDLLFESQQSQTKDEKQQDVMQQGKTSDEDEIEDELADSVDEELSESEIQQLHFFQQAKDSNSQIEQRQRKLRGSWYSDDSGFINPDYPGNFDD